MTENLEKGLDETVNKELQPCASAVGPRFFGDKIWLT